MFFMRRDEQMYVVGHQYISMNIATMFVAGSLQFFKIEPVVCIGTEYLYTIVAAQNDVLRLAWNYKSR